MFDVKREYYWWSLFCGKEEEEPAASYKKKCSSSYITWGRLEKDVERSSPVIVNMSSELYVL